MNKYVKGAMIFTGGLASGAVIGSAYIGLKVLNIDEFRDALAKRLSDKITDVLYGDQPRQRYKRTVDGVPYFKTTDVLFDTRREAVDVLNNLMCVCRDYGFCTVSDFCDITCVTNNHVYQSCGWYLIDVRAASIKNVGSQYAINLPAPARIYEK